MMMIVLSRRVLCKECVMRYHEGGGNECNAKSNAGDFSLSRDRDDDVFWSGTEKFLVSNYENGHSYL